MTLFSKLPAPPRPFQRHLLTLGGCLALLGGCPKEPSQTEEGPEVIDYPVTLDESTLLEAAAGQFSIESDASAGTEAPPDVPPHCEVSAERVAECYGDDPDRERRECAAWWACTRQALRADVLESVATCLGSLECEGDVSEDHCYTAAHLGVDPTPEGSDFEADCKARGLACSDEGLGFGSDRCAAELLDPGHIEKLQPCLARPCSEIADCMLDEQEALGCEK